MGNPIVGIIMGSDSDLPIMIEAKLICDEFGIESEVHIYSAHRSPMDTIEYARTAEERGLKVIIAGAGAAAHLAGVIASSTVLPVIGVPIQSGSLNGLDALLSTSQMPPGVPVASVAINGARNAGILATEIIATSNNELRAKVHAFKKKLLNDVKVTDENLPRLIDELLYKKHTG